MNICLFCSGSSEIQELEALVIPNRVNYCIQHGYSFHYFKQSPTFPEGGRAGERCLALQATLRTGLYEWIWQLDMDAIITNAAKPIEGVVDPDYSIILTTDAYNVQTGSFLIKNKPESFLFLDEVLKYRGHWPGPTTDQSAFQEIFTRPDFCKLPKFVTQRTMNSYQYKWYRHGGANFENGVDQFGISGEWQPGDLVLHVPGLPLKTKIEVLREALKCVQ